MNRGRLQILRDHLDRLPDDKFDMSTGGDERSCGTVACIGGWAERLFDRGSWAECLGLAWEQAEALFYPDGWLDEPDEPGHLTRLDAVAAIDSMLASEDEDALPVWPEKAVST